MLLEFPSHGGAGETLSRHCIKAAFVGEGIGGPAPSPGAEPEPKPPLAVGGGAGGDLPSTPTENPTSGKEDLFSSDFTQHLETLRKQGKGGARPAKLASPSHPAPNLGGGFRGSTKRVFPR